MPHRRRWGKNSAGTADVRDDDRHSLVAVAPVPRQLREAHPQRDDRQRRTSTLYEFQRGGVVTRETTSGNTTTVYYAAGRQCRPVPERVAKA